MVIKSHTHVADEELSQLLNHNGVLVIADQIIRTALAQVVLFLLEVFIKSGNFISGAALQTI